MKAISPISCLLGILLLAITAGGFAQEKTTEAKDEINCLEVTGKFDESMKSVEGKYTAKLLRDNKTVEEQVLKVSKGFRFVLKKDVQYTIRLEKEGYIPRLLSISTALPAKADVSEELYKFHFETNLIDEAFYTKFDDDDIDFPIALVNYAKKCDCFEYDKKYTEKLMARLVSTIMLGGY